MKRYVLLALVAAGPAWAEPDHPRMAEVAVNELILPVASKFETATSALAGTECGPQHEEALKAAYHDAWDAWLPLSVYRFGPLETDNRALQIAFWPDKKGFTPRSLGRMISAEDPSVDDPEAFASASVAARGLLALEWALYELKALDPYGCRLITAISKDLALTAKTIAEEWRSDWAARALSAGAPGNDSFRTPKEVTQRLFGALIGALTETIDLRLARPLGTLEKSRPRRAEAWRSDRPLRNISGATIAAADLYRTALRTDLSEQAQEELDIALASVLSALEAAQEVAPLTEAVTTTKRIRIDALQAALIGWRDVATEVLGPELGVSRGFNARDGD